MKAALRRIFWKNLLLLLAVVVAFVGFKYLTVKNAELLKRDCLYLDSWAVQCADKTDDELTVFVDTLAQKLDSDKAFRERAEWDTQKLLSSYTNRKETQRLISFAQTGEGVLPAGLPPNYLKLLDFYQQLDSPAVINTQPLDLYFAYQSENVVPVLVLILGAILWGVHFETEIYKYALTTKSGKTYSRTLAVTLILMGMLLFCSNELFDLWRSGLLEHSYIWESPVQSYSYFSNVQMNTSIGTVLLLVLCSKLLGLFILSHAAWLIARWKKSVKSTVIWVFLLLIILLFLGKAIENTQCYPLVQIGMVDWKQLIISTTILLPTGVAALPAGLVLTAVVEIILLGWCVRLDRN